MVAYLINTTIAWALLFCIYKLFLEKEKFFQLNRFYLLASLILGGLLPLISVVEWPITQQLQEMAPPIQQVYHNNLSTIENWTASLVNIDEASPSALTPERNINWVTIILMVYILGLLVTGLKTLRSFAVITKLIRSADSQKTSECTLCTVHENISPFSFFNFMVINRNNHSEAEIQNIIDHEVYHIEKLHTIDILITLLFKILFWWNPLPYFFAAALKLNHEYSADAHVLLRSSRKKYSSQLMQAAFPSVNLALTQPIFNSFIKKRITMMYQPPSKKMKMLKYGLGIMAIGFLSVLFTDSIYAYNQDGQSADIINQEKLQEDPVNNEVTEKINKTISSNLINGTVTASGGKPLIGVNVVVAGTKYGVITDLKGKYSISVPDDSKVVFSYVGYDTYSAATTKLEVDSKIIMIPSTNNGKDNNPISLSGGSCEQDDQGIYYRADKYARLSSSSSSEVDDLYRSLSTFAKERFVIPEEVVAMGFQWNVVVKVFINVEGTITDSEIATKDVPGLQSEIDRIIDLMNSELEIEAAECDGKKVMSSTFFSIKVKLDEAQKKRAIKRDSNNSTGVTSITVTHATQKGELYFTYRSHMNVPTSIKIYSPDGEEIFNKSYDFMYTSIRDEILLENKKKGTYTLEAIQDGVISKSSFPYSL